MKVSVPTDARPRVKRIDLRSLRVQAYDLDNIYPQRVINIITASGTASACAELFKKHLRGRGFAEPSLETFVVNSKGQTLGEVHNLLCDDRSKIKGFALHIGYNLLLEITSITPIPIEFVRIGIPDEKGIVTELAIHPDWANQKNLKKQNPEYYSPFTTDKEKIQLQIEKAGGFNEWKGHIYYESSSGMLQYPPAEGDSVLEDMETDGGIKIWKNRGVKTGWSATHFFVHRGKFENDEKRQEFVENLNSLQGYENSNKTVLIEAEAEEQEPKLIKVESISKEVPWAGTEETVRENIIRKYQQPLALHAIKVQGQLGLSKEWEEAKTNYDERTEDERNRISSVIAKLMALWHEGDPGKGKPEFYKVIPITGFPPVFVEKSLSETLLVGALTEVRSIIESTFLDEQQKINMLIAMYPIKKETAESMVRKNQNAPA